MLDLTKIYNELKKDLFELDKERRYYHSQVKPYQYMFWGWVVMGFLTLVWMHNFMDYHPDYVIMVYLFVLVIFLFMFVGITHNYLGKFKKQFTAQVAPKIIKGLGDSFTYDYQGGIPKARLRECLLFPPFTKYYHQDLVTGNIGDASITFNEIKLHGHSHRGGEKRSVVVFEGFFFKANIQVSFPTDIWLVFGNSKTLKDKEKIRFKIDHPGFNRYEFYTDDEEMARKILQPFILDKIKAVNEKIKRDKISRRPVSYHFGGNRVELAISSRKKFLEPRLSKSINNEGFIKLQTSLLNTLYNLISDLTLKY